MSSKPTSASRLGGPFGGDDRDGEVHEERGGGADPHRLALGDPPQGAHVRRPRAETGTAWNVRGEAARRGECTRAGKSTRPHVRIAPATRPPRRRAARRRPPGRRSRAAHASARTASWPNSPASRATTSTVASRQATGGVHRLGPCPHRRPAPSATGRRPRPPVSTSAMAATRRVVAVSPASLGAGSRRCSGRTAPVRSPFGSSTAGPADRSPRRRLGGRSGGRRRFRTTRRRLLRVRRLGRLGSGVCLRWSRPSHRRRRAPAPVSRSNRGTRPPAASPRSWWCSVRRRSGRARHRRPGAPPRPGRQGPGLAGARSRPSCEPRHPTVRLWIPDYSRNDETGGRNREQRWPG